jgi:hypothetical protein
MGRLGQGLVYGLVVGLLGALASTLPAMLQVEENLGLHALFRMRGVRPAPAEVLVVSLDKVSSDALGLPNQPSRWPRRLHAELVERLVEQGASVIGFDVQFHDPGVEEEDRRLGAALESAGNVVLTAVLRKSAVGGSRDGRVLLTTETVVPPVPAIAAGAAAVAPFPLPVVPVKVSQFWTWKASAGDIPTFPSVLFQAWMLGQGDWADPLASHCPALRELATDPRGVLADGRVVEFMTRARGCLAGNPGVLRSLRQTWSAEERPRALASLVPSTPVATPTTSTTTDRPARCGRFPIPKPCGAMAWILRAGSCWWVFRSSSSPSRRTASTRCSPMTAAWT